MEQKRSIDAKNFRLQYMLRTLTLHFFWRIRFPRVSQAITPVDCWDPMQQHLIHMPVPMSKKGYVHMIDMFLLNQNLCWFSEKLGREAQLITDPPPSSDQGVCRTAPATPGLLNAIQ